MSKIGIFFGTDTGTTRKIAKQIYRQLGEELADKPVNINRVDSATFSQYEKLILGTPTYGSGEMPGLEAECQEASWAEFAPELAEIDLNGKTIALFGLGDQVNYPDEFVDALGQLYDLVVEAGGRVVGFWPTDGYNYTSSMADVEGEFVGLVLDNDNQAEQNDQRLSEWLLEVKQAMLESECELA